jgi:predicted Zn-dependent peptidase
VIAGKLERTIGLVEKKQLAEVICPIEPIEADKTVTIAKKNTAQAQIVQGWLAPKFDDSDFFAMSVMNTVLGSCG